MANLTLDIHPEAQIEQDSLLEWYLDRSVSAAEAFIQGVEQARTAIQESPYLWAEYLHGTHRYLMRRFGIVVVYRVLPKRIEIIAIAHGRRKPGY